MAVLMSNATGVIALRAVVMFLVIIGTAQVASPQIKVAVNSNLLDLDVPPQVQNGRVLVPLRGVFEQLGAEVVWMSVVKEVRIAAGGKIIRLPLNSTVAYMNGLQLPVEVPAQIMKGRVMVPLCFIADALGVTVGWFPDQHLVRIESCLTKTKTMKVKEIIDQAERLQGKEVSLLGIYQGWQPSSGPATNAGPPVTRSDWGFSDGTGAIYVTKAAPNLDPYKDIGKAVRVRGIIRISPKGIVYIEATEVAVLSPGKKQ